VISLPTSGGDERYLADADGHLFKRAAGTEGQGLPAITGLSRDAYRSAHDPTQIAHRIVAALDVLRSWTHDSERPAMTEVQINPHGGFSLHGAHLAIDLGEGRLAARLATFDAVWRSLSDDERTHVTRIRLGSAGELGSRFDHVTVALNDFASGPPADRETAEAKLRKD
jgi:hypothetical protein